MAAGRDEMEAPANTSHAAMLKATEATGKYVGRLIFDTQSNIYPTILVYAESERMQDLIPQVLRDTAVHVISAVEGG